MGLSGTGSKDVEIEEAFVPGYRTLRHLELAEGAYGDRRADEPLYQIPWGCIFCAAIAAAAFGIASGALTRYHAYLESRVSAMGVVGKPIRISRKRWPRSKPIWRPESRMSTP